jgi:hypothetical protein
MRSAKLFLICLCCLIVVPAVWGQETKSSAKPGILGYLDPHTGAFRPVPTVVDENAEAPAAAVFGGTITVTLTITIKSVGITNVNCSADTSVLDSPSTGGVFWSELDSAPATGTTTKTCKLTIPYSWSLLTGTTDTMSTSYSVIGTGGANTRSASRSPLDVRKVPANGTITALTASVTI